MPLKPQESLSKTYRRQKPNRKEFESFRANLNHLLNEFDENEFEEHIKNDVIQFLNETWYKDEHLINTKDRTDLVIHNDKSAKSSVGVLIEVKKPSNKPEMISQKNLNAKALQELLLYYLRERHTNQNKEIKHLIVTNVYEWFIFDANQFYSLFYKNKKLLKSYEDWSKGNLEAADTTYFYKEIASLYISQAHDELEYTYFDFREYTKDLKNESDTNKLIALYKVLSPIHLLKKSFANDSNSLNKQFYHELLHIIGLEEVKEKGKKLIQRKSKDKRIEGSLLENAMLTMDEKDRLRMLNRPSHFGNNTETQLYTVALDLCITWINRILFLKLLESQLVSYHKGDKTYRFLDSNTIPNYDSLESLFFGVLARKMEDRADRYKEKYAKVPYLNSSLFEQTGLEEVLTITMLNNNFEHELYSRTVLKNAKGKPLSGKIDTLTYLFQFLDAYDFTSEGTEAIQEENKSLINASVLGLIFEKINGYKDGSFYTPGFITMYMCRETIRRTIIQKFNEKKGWELESFDQLYDKISNKQEANEIINSIKICDPAVGSGHFLVSALNEIIAIKSELKILLDRDSKTLRDYEITIENDELIIESEGELFAYTVDNKEKQRIQETLFYEKQTIIENCLFGVDINANSVKICRLRLWIELLKNAYYITSSSGDLQGFKNLTGIEVLQTLPNIDINIKTGNSLISRFDLDVDISAALKKSKGSAIQWDIETYKSAVSNYKNATSKEDKREFERLIEIIKGDFETEISKKDKRLIKSIKLKGELTNLTTQTSMFEMGVAEKKKWKKEVETKTTALEKVDNELEEVKSNKIYEDAFEWRFEFPEVLDDEGHFLGFDVVIGNPPYVQSRSEKFEKAEKDFFYKNYSTSEYQINLYGLFIEKGSRLLKNGGHSNLIVPNYWLSTTYDKRLRKYLFQENNVLELLNVYEVFEEAIVDTLILQFRKESSSTNISSRVLAIDRRLNSINDRLEAVKNRNWSFNKDIVFDQTQDDIEITFIDSISLKSARTIDDYFELKFGVKLYEVGKGTPKQSKEDSKIHKYESLNQVDDSYRKLLRARHVSKYHIKWKEGYLKYGINLAAPRETNLFKGERILVQRIFSKAVLDAAFTDKNYVCNTDVITLKPKQKIDCRLFLAIVVSKLSANFVRSKNVNLDRNVYPKINTNTLSTLPIPDIEKVDESLKNEIINLVQKVIDLKKDPNSVTLLHENKIDQLVYELYGLSEEEIKIVEGTNL